MNMLRSKLRWLVIPVLVLGMGATGVSNCLQFGVGCGSPISTSQKVRTCCCCKGHCHGQCGMACCQKPAPDQDRLPVEPKSHDDSGPSLGLVTTVAAGIDFASVGATQHGILADVASATACPSLLALNIRFNV
jgi:hypothetical protein